MKTKSVCGLAMLLCLAVSMVPAEVSALTLLIEQDHPLSTFGYGYGLDAWDTMSSRLDSAFGAGNITVNASPLDNLTYLLGFDRLWVTARQPGDGLSALESANIAAFAATGRRVVLTGENSAWDQWNKDILGAVGGTYSGLETSDTLAPVMGHQLTAGVAELETILDGLADAAAGGTALFSQNLATLWGDSQNVLSLLSVNVIDDIEGVSAGNEQFKINVAEWLAGGGGKPTPDASGTLMLLGSALAWLAGFARKTRA